MISRRLSVPAAAFAAILAAASLAGCSGASNGVAVNASQTTAAAPKMTRAERVRLRRLQALRRAAARRARIRAAYERLAAQERSEVADGTQPFAGTYFNIDYPTDWSIESNEEQQSGNLYDTTIRDPNDSNKLLRIDVDTQPGYTDPADNARAVEYALESQPGYRDLAFARTTLAGYDAVRWEFVVSEGGVLLHKVDTFFMDAAGDGVAVLTQAPVASFRFWKAQFAQIRQSIAPNDYSGSSGGDYSSGYDVPADFCSTHDCIPNFDNGTGYVVECNDGTWSHSGGRPGACSYHGGESGTTYDGTDGTDVTPSYTPPSSGTDLGPGNGYPVTCADGSISHSGGIQGACSDHGGIGP